MCTAVSVTIIIKWFATIHNPIENNMYMNIERAILKHHVFFFHPGRIFSFSSYLLWGSSHISCLEDVAIAPRHEKICFRGRGGGSYDQIWIKSVCSATETNCRLEIFAIASRDIILPRQPTIKVLIRMRGCLCCSHMAKTGFLMTWRISRCILKTLQLFSNHQSYILSAARASCSTYNVWPLPERLWRRVLRLNFVRLYCGCICPQICRNDWL